jgi:hypothetical protein
MTPAPPACCCSQTSLTSCIENTTACTVHKLYIYSIYCCVHYDPSTTCPLLFSNRLDFLHRRTQLHTSSTTILCCVHYYPSTTCLLLFSNQLDFLHRRTQLHVQYTSCTFTVYTVVYTMIPAPPACCCSQTSLTSCTGEHNCTQAVHLLCCVLDDQGVPVALPTTHFYPQVDKVQIGSFLQSYKLLMVVK